MFSLILIYIVLFCFLPNLNPMIDTDVPANINDKCERAKKSYEEKRKAYEDIESSRSYVSVVNRQKLLPIAEDEFRKAVDEYIKAVDEYIAAESKRYSFLFNIYEKAATASLKREEDIAECRSLEAKIRVSEEKIRELKEEKILEKEEGYWQKQHVKSRTKKEGQAKGKQRRQLRRIKPQEYADYMQRIHARQEDRKEKMRQYKLNAKERDLRRRKNRDIKYAPATQFVTGHDPEREAEGSREWDELMLEKQVSSVEDKRLRYEIVVGGKDDERIFQRFFAWISAEVGLYRALYNFEKRWEKEGSGFSLQDQGEYLRDLWNILLSDFNNKVLPDKQTLINNLGVQIRELGFDFEGLPERVPVKGVSKSYIGEKPKESVTKRKSAKMQGSRYGVLEHGVEEPEVSVIRTTKEKEELREVHKNAQQMEHIKKELKNLWDTFSPSVDSVQRERAKAVFNFFVSKYNYKYKNQLNFINQMRGAAEQFNKSEEIPTNLVNLKLEEKALFCALAWLTTLSDLSKLSALNSRLVGIIMSTSQSFEELKKLNTELLTQKIWNNLEFWSLYIRGELYKKYYIQSNGKKIDATFDPEVDDTVERFCNNNKNFNKLRTEPLTKEEHGEFLQQMKAVGSIKNKITELVVRLTEEKLDKFYTEIGKNVEDVNKDDMVLASRALRFFQSKGMDCIETLGLVHQMFSMAEYFNDTSKTKKSPELSIDRRALFCAMTHYIYKWSRDVDLINRLVNVMISGNSSFDEIKSLNSEFLIQLVEKYKGESESEKAVNTKHFFNRDLLNVLYAKFYVSNCGKKINEAFLPSFKDRKAILKNRLISELGIDVDESFDQITEYSKLDEFVINTLSNYTKTRGFFGLVRLKSNDSFKKAIEILNETKIDKALCELFEFFKGELFEPMNISLDVGSSIFSFFMLKNKINKHEDKLKLINQIKAAALYLKDEINGKNPKDLPLSRRMLFCAIAYFWSSDYDISRLVEIIMHGAPKLYELKILNSDLLIQKVAEIDYYHEPKYSMYFFDKKIRMALYETFYIQSNGKKIDDTFNPNLQSKMIVLKNMLSSKINLTDEEKARFNSSIKIFQVRPLVQEILEKRGPVKWYKRAFGGFNPFNDNRKAEQVLKGLEIPEGLKIPEK